MRCPVCSGPDRVIDSRDHYSEVRRRRQCRLCGYRWTTTESGTQDIFKRCTRCHFVWPRKLEFFNADKRNSDGLHSWCRQCFLKYDGRRKEERRQRGAAMRAKEAA